MKFGSGTVLKGTLLVAGTTIGGGMLGIPVLTSLGGFIPSIVIFFACWLVMTATALLILEVNLWMEGESNFVTMAERTLGTAGKGAAWGLYIFMFYTLSLAYVVGCSKILYGLAEEALPLSVCMVIFVALFAPCVYAGARVVGFLNVPLMAGLVLFYLLFVVIGIRYVDTERLLERNWLNSLHALPVAFTAFAFQGLIPTLSRYLGRDRIKVKKAIIYGSLIPLATYIVWQWLILGIIPKEGINGLFEAMLNDRTAVDPLRHHLNNPYVAVFGQYFAFFALLTSFLGVTLPLRDFLADGLHVPLNRPGRLLLSALIFIPVLSIAMVYPGIFLEALGYAGGYGSALLLGLLPICMVWAGRYRLGYEKHGIVPGGKATLSLLALFIGLEVVLETLHLIGKF